jgi:hypothetical protein
MSAGIALELPFVGGKGGCLTSEDDLEGGKTLIYIDEWMIARYETRMRFCTLMIPGSTILMTYSWRSATGMTTVTLILVRIGHLRPLFWRQEH